MKIIECDGSQREPWNRFVRLNASASFYHLYEWHDLNSSSFGHQTAYLAALENDRVVGVFPLVQVKSLLFGNIACSLPFVNYGGPCGESEGIVSALLDAGSEVAARWGVEYVEIRSRNYLGERLPSSDHKVSMTVDLNSDPDVLWNAFKKDQRRDIRRGYNLGLVARIGGPELLDDFFVVFSESWRDLGTPVYSKKYFAAILDTFKDAVRICVIYQGSEPAAVAFDAIHEGTAEGMWLGSRSKFRDQYAGYVLYWELIKSACEKGCSRYHLGRSTSQSGGERFKKNWNARTEPLYWHYLLRTRREIPQLNVQNSKYRLAIGAWRRLPVAVTQVVGPYIARSIP
jgi:FemAB-related protein (PEP-CTERM system-associated)